MAIAAKSTAESAAALGFVLAQDFVIVPQFLSIQFEIASEIEFSGLFIICQKFSIT